MAHLPSRNASVSLWRMGDETGPKPLTASDIDARLRRAIGRPPKLDPAESMSLTLEYMNGEVTISELARKWGISRSCARRTLHRVRAKLAKEEK